MPTYMPPDAAIQALMHMPAPIGDAGIEKMDPTINGGPGQMSDQGDPLTWHFGPFAEQPPVDNKMSRLPFSNVPSPSNQTPMVEALMRGS